MVTPKGVQGRSFALLFYCTPQEEEIWLTIRLPKNKLETP